MPSLPKPWPEIPVDAEHFLHPPREYGILPFWFLNGELEPEEMRYQLKQFREKGMPGIILHGRFGLEMPYIGEKYLERVRLAVDEAKKIGLQTWIYDEMNWPSGTADHRVVKERPDLTQRYLECLNFVVRGPWFTYLTGEDSRYVDFERSKPVAAFAVSLGGGSHAPGTVIDLTPNLSFEKVIPWEAPAGLWRLINIVEKEADYYIDALNPEATREFLRLGYEPYAQAVGDQFTSQMMGFYTDEPAMHYYVTGGDNPIVPWTRDMFRRFQERNGYNLRPRLPDLFFDISPDSARVRYDFYCTTTEFYSQAYYKQIHDWCEEHGVLFTGHLLYEEWLRKLIRVEGNLFKHYPYLHMTGVDHLYPIVGNRDRPDEHVAMKVGSSAAHQLRSPRLLCESFGGIFMDATMQRMKWIADWEYVLGVNLLNPHGFHYTLEGPRKRDWPPSQFYQYPWWQFYGSFSEYMSRLSHLLSGGRHVAKVAVLWPLNGLIAHFTPQSYDAPGERLVQDFNALTDLLLRIHSDFDYLDEDVLAGAKMDGAEINVADEAYQVVILPPLTHIKVETLERLERFVAQGGRVMGTVFLPTRAFAAQGQGLVDISARVAELFGVDPAQTQREYAQKTGIDVVECNHSGGGKTAFLRSYAVARNLPARIHQEYGLPGEPDTRFFSVETENETSRYFFNPPSGERAGHPVEITAEVKAERAKMAEAVRKALRGLAEPDVIIDNPDIYSLHRVKNDARGGEQDIFFFVNSTFTPQTAQVTLHAHQAPMLWDPSTGSQRPAVPAVFKDGQVTFPISLPPVGSAFVVPGAPDMPRIVDTNLTIDQAGPREISGYGAQANGFVVVEKDGRRVRLESNGSEPTGSQPAGSQPAGSQPAGSLSLNGDWQFSLENDNALVIGRWLSRMESSADEAQKFSAASLESQDGWQEMVPGAWSFQLPAEPSRPYPVAVWYRIPFEAGYAPEKLSLIIDGFAGSEWKLFANGHEVTEAPVRSELDAQMKAVEIGRYARKGQNVIALRLVVTNPTDGLLDLVKLTGDFRLEPGKDGGFTLAAPSPAIRPADWAVQGYPFFSGRGVYRRAFQLPEAFTVQRVFLKAALHDDAVEVLVNGQSAGVRLWPPYEVEITGLLRAGQNTLELRVANTLVNLLEATPRPSGISGAPEVVGYTKHAFNIQ